MRPVLGVAFLALAAAGAACAPKAPYVWVDSYRAPRVEPGGYVIRPGDLVSVQVWEQEKMSTRARVRTDGKISVPFLYDVIVAGKRPSEVAHELEANLKQFMLTPRVNVVVEEPKALSVSVIGEVGKPGLYILDPGSGVAQALAAAGGLSEFARKDRIFVLRGTAGRQQRIRFTYPNLVGAIGAAVHFSVQDGDIVVVE